MIAYIVLNGTIVAAIAWVVVRWARARRAFTPEASAKDALAHWRYPANEWHLFCEAEAARIRRGDLPRVMKRFAGPAVFLAALLWYMYDPAKPGIFDLRLAGLVLVALIAAILVAIVLGRAWYYLRLRDLEYEVYLGPGGLYEVFKKHGEVRRERKTLFGPDYDLGGVALQKEAGYSYLQLTLRGDRGGELQKRVPVPRGKESQAEKVAAMLGPGAGS